MSIPSLSGTPYGLVRALPGVPFADAVARTRAALAAQGFGVLTEIDLRGTLKAKLGVDVRDYVVLGACNPPLVLRALTEDPAIGLLIPCNVTVSADDAGGSVVATVDPLALFTVAGRPELVPVAQEVHDRLVAALDGLAPLAR